MLDGRELIANVAAHALGRARRVDEFRMLRLERAQLVHERVERAVGDRGRIEGVIEIAVVLDFPAERLDARCRIGCLSSQFIAAELILLLFGHIRPFTNKAPGMPGPDTVSLCGRPPGRRYMSTLSARHPYMIRETPRIMTNTAKKTASIAG